MSSSPTATIRAAIYRELYRHLLPGSDGVRPTASGARDLPRPLSRGLSHFLALIRSRSLAGMTPDLADLVAVALSTWFENLYRRITAREADTYGGDDESLERAIRPAVTPLADHINESLPDLATLEQRCREVFRRPGWWNLFDDRWRSIDWTVLNAAQTRLDREPETQRIAETIARGPIGDEPRTVWRRVPVNHITVLEREAGHGEIDGLAGGSGVQLALPSELALLATPETEDLFSRKLAEQGVLSLHSDRRLKHRVVHTTNEWRQVPAPRAPGPLYICLDTSGSMEGESMTAAEAFVLGTLRGVLLRRRPMTLLAVRGFLRELELSSPSEDGEPDGSGASETLSAASPSRIDEGTILALSRFLGDADAPGADVTPAIDRVLPALEEHSGWDTTAADLVIISDTRFPRITPLQGRRLRDLQRQGRIVLHAITIGDAAMYDPLNSFDAHYHYDTRSDETRAVRGRSDPRVRGFQN